MSTDPPPPPTDPATDLAAAHAAWRPLRRAAGYATADAWTLAVFAVLSLVCGIGGVAGPVLGGVLGVIAGVEFAAVRRLRRLDAAALRWLAVNQLVLAGVVVVYAGWNLYLTAAGQGLLAYLAAQPSLTGGDPQALAMATDVLRRGLLAMYAILIVIGGGVPAMTAWYYSSRGPLLQRYVTAVAPWVAHMQRERGRL